MKILTTLNNKKYIVIIISFFFQITTFAQTQKGTDIDGERAGDYSGEAVSMPDANTLAIGGSSNNGNGSTAGHVRVYNWSGSAWVQKGADIDGEAAGDGSGCSVSMPDANTIAIGASFNSSWRGHVRVYNWSGSAWVQKGADIDGEAAGDGSGKSVSMPDANTLAIGAPSNAGNGWNAGHVKVYNWSGTAWVQKGADIDGEASGNNSGEAVSMPDANTIAIGSPKSNGNGSDYCGHVRVYNWSGTAWVQKGADIDGERARDYSGCSVSMPDANTIAIGGLGNDGNGTDAGHVRVYDWSGTAWVQGGADIDGEAAGDNSGQSVSMPDVNTLAIGGNGNDGNGSDDCGHVRVYNWSGSAWVQKGADIDGESNIDNSGESVSMPDKNTLAIGAMNNEWFKGHVRVYSMGSLDVLENSVGNTLEIYPNPAKNVINVKTADTKLLGMAYSIYDNTGKVVLSGKITSENTSIELGNLAAGIYMLSIADNMKQTFKVIKR